MKLNVHIAFGGECEAAFQFYERCLGGKIVHATLEAERVFQALAENGTVQMPLQKTFWAVRFGVLVDQFGISWEVNCEQAQ
jgi:uncharacterized glyoxalase superfamily protein PhnB